jgi:hypothetical protein
MSSNVGSIYKKSFVEALPGEEALLVYSLQKQIMLLLSTREGLLSFTRNSCKESIHLCALYAPYKSVEYSSQFMSRPNFFIAYPMNRFEIVIIRPIITKMLETIINLGRFSLFLEPKFPQIISSGSGAFLIFNY